MDENSISKMLHETDILSSLKKNKLQNKEKVLTYLNEDTIRNIDSVVNIINQNLIEPIPKNVIIETAVKEFITRINSLETIKRFSDNKSSIDHVVIIFTSNDKKSDYKYEKRFYGNQDGKKIRKRWSAVNIGRGTIDLINRGVIRYISIYRSGDKQYIEEYGEIEEVEKITKENVETKENIEKGYVMETCDTTEKNSDIGKYRIYIKGEIKRLPKKVKLGSAEASSLMRGRRTTLRKLMTIDTIDEL